MSSALLQWRDAAVLAANHSSIDVLPNIIEKSLFPLDGNDVLVGVLSFLASALGAAGGIGGGGIMVPLLVSVGGFSIHHAIPLTQATVFGASLMNLVQNISKRHPTLDRPLIDYDTALILEVATLLGTVIGVDLNRVSPVWLITVLLIVTLSFTTYRTLLKAFELRKIENSPAAVQESEGGREEEEEEEEEGGEGTALVGRKERAEREGGARRSGSREGLVARY